MYEKLARDIFFNSQLNLDQSLKTLGLEYRKGKTVKDVEVARKKALKAGGTKIEFELSWLELYLKGVLKKVRVKASNS